MPFHVAITRKSSMAVQLVKLDVSDVELQERFLDPYYAGEPVTLRGVSVSPSDIHQISITRTSEASAHYMPAAQRECDESAFPISVDAIIASMGTDVTDEFIQGAPGSRAKKAQSALDATLPKPRAPVDPRRVFVVHGRNQALRDAMFTFLRNIGLLPLEWNEAVKLTRKASPYIGEVLDCAFSSASSIVVLLTPDDEARLREKFRRKDEPPHEAQLTGQARPNVLFEAGMAMGRCPDRTVLVEVGCLRPFTDVSGVHVVRMDGSSQRRQELAQRLETAGAAVVLSGTDWHTAGDFSAT